MTKTILFASALTVAVALGGPITDSPETSTTTMAAPSSVAAPSDGPLLLALPAQTSAVSAVADPATTATSATPESAPAVSSGPTADASSFSAPVPLAGGVPEPSTFGYLAVGLSATLFGGIRRRKS